MKTKIEWIMQIERQFLKGFKRVIIFKSDSLFAFF